MCHFEIHISSIENIKLDFTCDMTATNQKNSKIYQEGKCFMILLDHFLFQEYHYVEMPCNEL